MALHVIPDNEAMDIVKNLVRASTENINRLSEAGYRYIYLARGFIAHYDRHGFIATYGTADNLADDILANQDDNQNSNFQPGENDYEYQMQKKNIYNAICDGIKKFRSEGKQDPSNEKDYENHLYRINIVFEAEGKDAHSAMAKALGNSFLDIRGGYTMNYVKL